MRSWITVSLVIALVVASAPSLAQLQTSPNAHPAPIMQGQNTTPVAPQGGIDQTGIATPPSALPPASGPLPPGSPAGDERAASLSNGELIAAGVVVTAAVVCAIACFSNSSSTTTSTTAIHR